jgi:hypothetical protein
MFSTIVYFLYDAICSIYNATLFFGAVLNPINIFAFYYDVAPMELLTYTYTQGVLAYAGK